MSSDPKGYRQFNVGVDEAFIDPWGGEILYYRGVPQHPESATAAAALTIFDVPANINTCLFLKTDNTVTAVGGSIPDPSGFPVFLKLLGSSSANNVSGAISGEDNFLLVSAGPDGVYFSADDIVDSK